MKVTRETIEHVANLARLNLTESEKDSLTVKMGDILSWVDKLSELDVSDVKPMEHVIPIWNVLREDEVSPSTDRGKILANAPMSENGCFKVPKVVE